MLKIGTLTKPNYHGHRYPYQRIVSHVERIQTYRYRVTLTCGHIYSVTRSANKRGQLPKGTYCRACPAVQS